MEYIAAYKVLVSLMVIAFLFPITGTYTFSRVYIDMKCNDTSTSLKILLVTWNDTRVVSKIIPEGCSAKAKIKAFAGLIYGMFGKLENCKDLGKIQIPFKGHPTEALVGKCELALSNGERTEATIIVNRNYDVLLFTTSFNTKSKYGADRVAVTIEPIDIIEQK